MMVNNPKRNIRLIDLLDMSVNNLYDFSYEKLYEVVGEWLKSEKDLLVNPDDYNVFIKFFCDRYFRRSLNFDTFLDFKIALRNMFEKYREKAKRMYHASLIEIDPLQTHFNEVHHEGSDRGESSTDSSNHTTSDNNRDFEYENTDFHLHSDTPSDTVNITDMFDKSTYVTDASNDKNVNKSKLDKTHSDIDGSGHSSGNFKNSNFYDDITKGYDGVPSDLLNKFIDLNLDVVNFYIDMVEKECLFSATLY